MIRSLWISATGLDAQQMQLDTISQNLANVSTNGYKRAHAQFEDLLYQNMRQSGSQETQATTTPVGLQLGTGVRPVGTTRLFSQGNLNKTENPMDLAINGKGFFQVQMPDGTTSYTRDGGFKVDSQGQIVTSNGYPLNPAITVPASSTALSIGSDGTVTSTTATGTTTLGQITTANFINPAGLDPAGQNIFRETVASGTPAVAVPGVNGHGTISQGYVETSNVNVVEELVAMIQTQRAYEINSKAIQTSDQMLAKLAQL